MLKKLIIFFFFFMEIVSASHHHQSANIPQEFIRFENPKQDKFYTEPISVSGKGARKNYKLRSILGRRSRRG